jgi:signal transduction histidine kinase
VTWPVLCSELRRYGGQMIESYGKSFTMNTKVENEGRPSSALSLAVLRVFREALTNIVKHAQASKVEVELVVDLAGFCLKIADDGEGSGAGGGLDTGRGMNNMRSRAKELGGELTVSKATPGTALVLRLPITRNSPGAGEVVAR